MIPPKRIREAMEAIGLGTYRLGAIMAGRRLDDIAKRKRLYAQLRSMGYSYPQIGQAVGRDSSTIIKVLKREAHQTEKRI